MVVVSDVPLVVWWRISEVVEVVEGRPPPPPQLAEGQFGTAQTPDEEDEPQPAVVLPLGVTSGYRPEAVEVVASCRSNFIEGGFKIPGLGSVMLLGGCEDIEATVGELEAVVEVELEAGALNVANGGAFRFRLPE